MVDWECGDRDHGTFERLWERLTGRGVRLACTDDWAVYREVIPVGRHLVGKDQTHGLERIFSSLRHWLARFRRRGIMVSKAQRMVEASIALFARFHVNGATKELESISA